MEEAANRGDQAVLQWFWHHMVQTDVTVAAAVAKRLSHIHALDWDKVSGPPPKSPHLTATLDRIPLPDPLASPTPSAPHAAKRPSTRTHTRTRKSLETSPPPSVPPPRPCERTLFLGELGVLGGSISRHGANCAARAD